MVARTAASTVLSSCTVKTNWPGSRPPLDTRSLNSRSVAVSGAACRISATGCTPAATTRRPAISRFTARLPAVCCKLRTASRPAGAICGRAPSAAGGATTASGNASACSNSATVVASVSREERGRGRAYDRVVIDEATEFGARVARHLRDDIVVWLTTVTPRGAPLPSPVWFFWDGAESVLMYSMAGARVRNVEANPRVTLNFAGDGRGGDIVVLSGAARIDGDAPAADRAEAYLAKYREHITRIGRTPATFAQRYSVPVRIELTRLRGH